MQAPPGQASLTVNWHNESVTVPCQFNPTEFQIEKQAQYAEITIPGLAAPLQQFVRGAAAVLTAELFFDTSDRGTGLGATAVTTLTDPVFAALLIDPELHTPPSVVFRWGAGFPGANLPSQVQAQARNSFRGILTSVRQSFTFFSRLGVPLRAKLTLSLREYFPLQDQLRDLRLASPDRTHGHVLARDETLAMLAERQYGQTREWRRIAAANRIEDPRRLSPGRRLSLPSIPAAGGTR
jgi:hypothetical protein